MTQLLSVMTQSNAAPMELNLARILRNSLRQNGQQGLSGLPGVLILKDTKTRLKLRLAVNPKTGIAVSRAGAKETALVEGQFDPFSGRPPNFELRGGWRKPLIKRRLAKLFQPTLTPWQTAAEAFYNETNLLEPNEFSIESYSAETDSRHLWGNGPEMVLILASAVTLSNLYNGYSLLIDDILKGRIQCQASMRAIAIITDATTDHWMDLQ